MADIVRYTPGDRRAVDAIYRRVFGTDAANANRLRWDWQYGRNPNNPPDGPLIWLAREGPTLVGQFAAMPVRLRVLGEEIQAGWGMDAMVVPERQRQGIGEVLFRTWDRHVGASLGLGLSLSSERLFRKLKWPDAGRVPCLVKPLTRRAYRRPNWPVAVNRLVGALTYPYVRYISRRRPLAAQIEPVRQFDERFTTLWDRVADQFDLAARRDASYLTWRFVEPPHIRYSIVALLRDGCVDGYAVYRHVREPLGRVTLLVDFLADPADGAGFATLLGWVDREARAADSDTIRAYALHAGFGKGLRRAGYAAASSSLTLTAKINAVTVPPRYYDDTSRWHVTWGDADLDH